jgi:predicted DNA binding CopG/RHH family protein
MLIWHILHTYGSRAEPPALAQTRRLVSSDWAESASSAPAIGGKESDSVSNRTVRYTAGEIGRVRVIEDFLPAPADLVPREENVKVTLSLSRRSLDFFKREAKKRRVPYQRMIRALVDTYADRQAGGRAK